MYGCPMISQAVGQDCGRTSDELVSGRMANGAKCKKASHTNHDWDHELRSSLLLSKI